MSTESAVVEHVFSVPPEKVWKALTSTEGMTNWYFDIAEIRPEVGFEFRFTGEAQGKTYSHYCRVTEVIENRRFAHTWAYDGFEKQAHLSFNITPEGGGGKGGARLKVTHTGLEAFHGDPNLGQRKFQEAWEQIIGTGLKGFLENS